MSGFISISIKTSHQGVTFTSISGVRSRDESETEAYNRRGQLPDRIFIDERPSVGEFLSLIVYLHDLGACDLKVSLTFRKCNQSGK